MTITKTLQKHFSKVLTAAYDVKNMNELWSDHGVRVRFDHKNGTITLNGAGHFQSQAIASVNRFVDRVVELMPQYNIEAVHEALVYIDEKNDIAVGLIEINVTEKVETTNDDVIVFTPPVVEETISYTQFEIINYNKRADSPLLIKTIFVLDDVAQIQSAMDNANGTGGYQFILTDAEGNTTKKFTAKSLAMELLAALTV